jgi:hypothetical protein
MKLGVTGSVYKKQPLGKTATPTVISHSVIRNNPDYPEEAIGVAEIRNNDVESVTLYRDGISMPLPVAPGEITERVLVTRPLTSKDLVVVKISAKAR